ncbi:NUDIX hydrolase [Candidatus Uhrbacteria bacterium]|nr:NUDIX hydrolase [Candidatus Uhrbacteria bacterium]
MGKLPSHAKKVFEGVIFDVYQWEQKMYDGSTAVFERLDRADTVEIIAVTLEGKILIQRQQQPDSEEWFLDTIAGRVEADEEPFDGAKREMLEETGYASEAWFPLEVFRPNGKIDWNIHLFVARDSQKVSEQNLDPGERIEVREVTFDEFIELVDTHKMKRVSYPLRERCIRAKYDSAKKEEFRAEIFGGL